MAAGPILHIFPPVEEVNRRKESVDDLIRRSLDMRPTGPFPARGLNGTPIKTSNAHNINSLPRPSNSTVGIAITHDRSPSPLQERVRVLPSIEEAKDSPRETPFQRLPPILVPKRGPSATRGTRPRRSSSVGTRNKNGGASPAQRRAPSPGPFPVHRQEESPATANSTMDSALTATFVMERDIPSRSSNRSRVCIPQRQDGGEVAAITSPVNPCGYYFMPEKQSQAQAPQFPGPPKLAQPPQRQASVRSVQSYSTLQSHSTYQTQSTFQCQGNLQRNASRSTQRSRYAPGQHRDSLQTPVSEYDGVSPSSTLGRNSYMSHKGWSPATPQQKNELPMRSMFPQFNHEVPLAQQAYRPRSVVPSAMISPDMIGRAPHSAGFERVNTPYSAGFNSALLLPNKTSEPVYLTPAFDLDSLWATANGKISAPDPKHFTMKLFRQDADKTGKEKLTFGPTKDEPFYSLSKTHTKHEEGEDHELLVQRHHTSGEDILPITHHELHPPPPPTMSTSRGSLVPDVTGPAQHVATIIPILATLHALEGAAKTPQAQTIALVDPNATSPAAAKLAERAVAEAKQRESCTLAWSAQDANTGKYELHHPSLGVFNTIVTGDVKSAMEFGVVKGATSISILNPYASMSPLSGSPVSAGSRNSAATIVDHDHDILARIDFQEGCLHVDAATIQSLGNIYLVDVCVSTLLSIAVAEAKRREDPGLVFAAPPPSLMSFKATSKKIKSPKIREINETPKPLPKKNKKPPRPVTIMANSLGLGFEHLAEKDDLPRITKAILSLLGISFKGAVYLMGMGVKVLAQIVIWMTRKAMTEKEA